MPVSHLVSAGDTLFSIAFQYDMDFRTLALANGLNPPYTIFVGQQLQLKAAAAIANAAVQAVGEGINSAINAVPVGGESSNSLRQPGAGPDTGQLRWSWPHQGQIATPFQPQLTKEDRHLWRSRRFGSCSSERRRGVFRQRRPGDGQPDHYQAL